MGREGGREMEGEGGNSKGLRLAQMQLHQSTFARAMGYGLT